MSRHAPLLLFALLLSACSTGSTGTGAPSLSFTTQPTTIVGGETIDPQVTVILLDAQGLVATSATAPVTLALAGDPGLALLAGTLTVVPSQGVASFDDLTVHGPAGALSLSASADGFASADSQAFQVQDVSLPGATGDLATFLKSELLPSIPGVSGSGAGADPADQMNHYVLPTVSQLATWRVVFQKLLAGDPGGAHTLAKTISATYNVVEFTDTATGVVHLLLMEGGPGAIPAPVDRASSVSLTDPADPARRGWGAYLFDPLPSLLLSLSAPHPKDDLETGDAAIEVYLETRCHSLLLAGTDRDQNPDLAPCDQSSRPYLEADVAHHAESVFQIAFEQIDAAPAGPHHLQLHGNATCGEDVFLSNGVSGAPAIVDTLGANIAAVSADWAGDGATLTIDVWDDPGDCPLRATQNTQMRFAAGIPHGEICGADGPTSNSRFIHLEASRIARRALDDPLATPGQNRAVLIEGIRLTF